MGFNVTFSENKMASIIKKFEICNKVVTYLVVTRAINYFT